MKKTIFVQTMHESNTLGNTPKNTNYLVLETSFKSGYPPSEKQYFSTFQIPLEPRCHLKNIDLHF